MDNTKQVADNVDDLINLFEKHLFRSSSEALKTYTMLVERMKQFYLSKDKIDLDITIREKILTFLLNLRVNHIGQIAYDTKTEACGIACAGNDTYLPSIQFSPYVLCTECICNIKSDDKSTLPSPPLSPCVHGEAGCHNFDLNEVFKVTFKCLQLENDWQVIKTVLQRLRLFILNNPEVFKFTCYQKDLNDGGIAASQAYVASTDHRSIANNLVSIACSLINDKTMRFADGRSIKTDFEIYVYQVLEVLIVHGRTLDVHHRRKLVETISGGLRNVKYTKATINSLTFCMMEMQDLKMGEIFKRILLDISKTSPSRQFALPKLNFLSNLILFSNLYSNFNDREYLFIFAIAIPYTNYPEFDAFTVALAHRVVAMWFLTCKLPYRKDVVKYIYTNLALGAQTSYRNRSQSTSSASIGNGRSPDPLSRPPHTPSHLSRHPNSPSGFSTHSSSSNANFFFSDSQSLTSSRHIQQGNQSAAVNSNSVTASNSPASSSSAYDHQVQKELFETCMDLLQRYTYGSCSSIPPNHPYAHLLVDRSTARSWLIGSSIITISTSGCQSRVVADGLCRKCLDHFKRYNPNEGNRSAPIIGHSERRRHQSDFQRRTPGCSVLSNASIYSANTKSLRSMDDSHISTLDFTNYEGYREGHCSCWCQGWAEIVVRQPTGKMTSMLRLTNSLSLPMSNIQTTSDLSNIYDPQFLNLNRTILEQSKIDDTLDDNSNCENSSNDAVIEGTGESYIERTSIDNDNHNECKDLTPSDGQIDYGVEPLCLSLLSGRNSSEDGNVDTVTPSIDSNTAFNSNDSTSGTSGMATESSSSSSVFSSSSTSSVNSTISTAGNVTSTGTWSNNFSKQKIARAQSLGQSDRCRISPEKVHRPELTIPNTCLINCNEYADSANQTATAPPILTSSNEFSPLSASSSLIRQRSHTVSGQQGQRHTLSGQLTAGSCLYSEPKIHGISPSFVFLKFYGSLSSVHGSEKPLLLHTHSGDILNRAIRNIDMVFPFETHKIAIVYVGLGQENSKFEILANEFGSFRYQDMLSRIGNLQRLQEIDEQTCFIGGLDKSGKDGKFVYCWHDNLTQIVFHVATLMPTDLSKDKFLVEKLKHVGNDSVAIIYNDSGKPFNRSTLGSEFLRFFIIVTPLGCNLNLVQIQTDPEISKQVGHADSCMLSDENLPLYIRQIAIQANLLFTQQLHSIKGGIPFISNWVERLRKLKSLREKALEDLNSATAKSNLANRTQSETHNRPVPPLNIYDYPDDFTRYTL